jgi:hypothetical protein
LTTLMQASAHFVQWKRHSTLQGALRLHSYSNQFRGLADANVPHEPVYAYIMLSAFSRYQVLAATIASDARDPFAARCCDCGCLALHASTSVDHV